MIIFFLLVGNVFVVLISHTFFVRGGIHKVLSMKGVTQRGYAQRQLLSLFGKLPFANGALANGAF